MVCLVPATYLLASGHDSSDASLDTENTVSCSTFTNVASLEQGLDAIRNARLKLMWAIYRKWCFKSLYSADCLVSSIPSLFSYGRLCISKPSMQSILRRYNISSDFASVLLAFSEPPRISEQGYECFARETQSDKSYGMLCRSCGRVRSRSRC
jgi:hypothetical protein